MPAFLNGTGDVSVGDQITNGDDLYIIASGAVTVGTIDTRSDSRVGAVVIVASASNITYRGNPVDGQMEILCTSCSSSAQDYNFETPTAYTADVNVGGNVDGSEVSLAGLNVQVDGHVTGWTDPSGTINADVFFAANAIINIEDDITSYGTVLVETNATEFTVSGDINSQANVEIAIPGSVSIEGDLLAGQSNNGLGNYAEVSAGMQESSPTSPISIGGQVKCPGGSIILTASGTISATDLSVSLPSCLGPQTVQIQANQGQTGSVAAFGVGSSGSNGVSSIENVSDTGCTGVYNQRFIYISNGPGDITIADGSLIDGTGTECQTAMLVIDASKSNTSTISLNGGTLATDGSDTYPGNVLALFAGTISFANTPTISASDGASGGDGTYITLCCNTISYDSVTINCNGENAPRTISLVPPGSQHITVGYEELELGEVNPVDGPLTIEGSGTFSVNANGLYGNPNIFGDPISFNNSGPINITANSQAYPLIFVDTINGGDIYFNGSGPITFNADADIDGGDSGGIYCYCGNFATSNASFTCSANSTNNGANIFLAGGGGWTAPMSLSANCTQGNGGNIQINYIYYFSPSSISITANGGTSDGPGGSVLFNNLGEISLPGSIVANGQGAGAGGQITFESGTMNSPSTAMTLNVDALGDGNGGSISFSGNGGIATGNSSSPGILSAQSLGAGNGGTIDLNTNSAGDVTIDTTSLLAGATSDSGGTGGNITLNGNNVSFPTTGELNADGFQGGGQISITSEAGDINVGYGGDAIPVSAQALSTGNGGSIGLTSAGNVGINPANLLLNAGSGGNGGTLTISATQTLFAYGTVDANGQGSGTGGTLSLSAFDVSLSDITTMNAIGGSSGDGGSVSITQSNTGTSTTDLSQLNLYIDGGTNSGDGGDVTLSFAASGLNIGGISATSPSEGDGGDITVTGTTNVDMNITCFGKIDTTDNEDFGGSFTLVPFDSDSNNLSFNIEEDADFQSVLSANAQSINVQATAVVLLELNQITSSNGDITLNVPESSGSIAAIKDKSVSQDAEPSYSEIRFSTVGTIAATNGNLFIVAPLIHMYPTSIAKGAGPGKTINIQTNKIIFENGSSVNGNGGKVTLYGLDFSQPLSVNVVGGTGGFVDCSSLSVSGGDGTEVNARRLNLIVDSGTGTANLQLQTTSAGTATLIANILMIGAGLSAIQAYNLVANVDSLELDGEIDATNSIVINANDTSLGNIVLNGVLQTTGSTGSENISVNNNGSGSITATTSCQLTSNEIDLSTAGNDIGSDIIPIDFSASQIQISSGGAAYASTGDEDLLTLLTSTAVGSFSLFGGGPIVLEGLNTSGSVRIIATQGLTVSGLISSGSPGSASGDLLLSSASGVLQINNTVSANSNSILNVSLQNEDTLSGTIVINDDIAVGGTSVGTLFGNVTVAIVIGSIPSSPVAGEQPANVTPEGVGAFFWGTSPGIIAGVGCQAFASLGGDTIIFETLGRSGAITLGTNAQIGAFQ